jgi:hypothetical protein
LCVRWGHAVLKVLLGEMHFIPSGPDSWFNLPRQSVAYAAQQSWVQSGTIRVSFYLCPLRSRIDPSCQENIIFGAVFDENRYNIGLSLSHPQENFSHVYFYLVLHQCALERDISLFDAGDRTEVGEKGITLRLVVFIFLTASDLTFICSGGQKVNVAFLQQIISSILFFASRRESHWLEPSTHLQRFSCWTMFVFFFAPFYNI